MESMTEVSIVFESPYWIVLIEDYFHGEYSVAKQVIGTSEPTGPEISMFFDHLDSDSLKFTRSVAVNKEFGQKISFKRRMRESQRTQHNLKVLHAYTKAHTLLKLQRVEKTTAKRKQLKIEKEVLKDEKYRLRQIKKKEKYRGH